eukprot:2648846-Rhodomonas_salina.1
MLKREWQLTDCHAAAMFVLPPEHGGMAKSLPGVILAKHTVGLTLKLTACLDCEIMRLMQADVEPL